MSDYIDIFSIFARYSDIAPKNLDDVKVLEERARVEGKESLAEYLFLWRTDMEHRLEKEHT